MKKLDSHLIEAEEINVGAESDEVSTPSSTVNRRTLLKGGGIAMAFAGLAGFAPSAEASTSIYKGKGGYFGGPKRRYRAMRNRIRAANSYLDLQLPRPKSNNDETRYDDYRANFFKTLPQNELGEVDPSAYRKYLKAIRSARSRDFDAIPTSIYSERGLANPQAAYAYEMTGLDSHSTRMPSAPKFASATQVAEIAEVYWQAITRDVPFDHYDSDPLIEQAITDLNRFKRTVGPKSNGAVTYKTLFRGETPGDLIGPYISQFLWHDVPYGPFTIVQKFDPTVPNVDFGTRFDDWLAIQRGAIPDSSTFVGAGTYINDNRALGEYVHNDYPGQAYLNAGLIMSSFGPDALADSNPYKNGGNQEAFVTFGMPMIGEMVTKASRALTAAWFQKWLIHRRLRPEVFAGRVDLQMRGVKDYGIHHDIFNSDAVAELLSQNGNALLPLAFPEGSPTHPSYPAGHAAVSGACATVLKAFFNEDFAIPNPVVPSSDGRNLNPWTGNDLTLGNEINKLANNISIGRDAAGVHYRSDGVEGLEVGEQYALGLLKDCSRSYNEDFGGFVLTRFNGTKARIRKGKILN
ncbi:MAG: vanadium-dependent haloperoxidase [Pseudomonadota bacterium]